MYNFYVNNIDKINYMIYNGYVITNNKKGKYANRRIKETRSRTQEGDGSN